MKQLMIRLCAFAAVAAGGLACVGVAGNDGTKDAAKSRVVAIVGYEIDLDASECLYRFDTFDPKDWTIVKHTPKWTVGKTEIVGGAPDEPHHGQIFYKTPVKGNVVLEFDARVVPPSKHDIVWFWGTEFDREPWSGGHLASLGGWWANLAGIEALGPHPTHTICDSFPIEAGRTYHIVSGNVGGSQFVVVDGKLVSQLLEPAPKEEKAGYFGFGIYQSMVAFSHLRVYRPKATRPHKSYVPAKKR